MLKFAQLEFRSGSVERGRTLMEGLLQQNPKRADLWSVFIDLEMKQLRQLTDPDTAEALSNRAAPKIAQKDTAQQIGYAFILAFFLSLSSIYISPPPHTHTRTPQFPRLS